MDIKEFKIDDDVLLLSRDKSVELGHVYNSITRGSGNLAGFIGEIVAQKEYGGVLENTYNYDLVLPDGRRIDVKTKRTSVAPLPTYDCSVTASQIKYDCDGYLFIRVSYSYDIGWLLGYMKKEDFIDKSTFHKKGESVGNNFKFRADCYNVKIDMLESV